MKKNILVIDIGNTHIVIGAYQEDKFINSWRMSSNKKKTEDEYFSHLKNLLPTEIINNPFGCVMSSVVPELTRVFTHLAKKYLNNKLINITADFDLGMKYRMEDPSTIGADLIVNAYGALQKFKTNCIICDFGTATTIQLIQKDGLFRGTAIAPGMLTSAQILFQSASKLTSIELAAPKKTLGTNTKDALLSGIINGHTSLTDGIVQKIIDENQHLDSIKVIATGGISKIIKKNSKTIDIVEKNLILDSLFAIGKKYLR